MCIPAVMTKMLIWWSSSYLAHVSQVTSWSDIRGSDWDWIFPCEWTCAATHSDPSSDAVWAFFFIKSYNYSQKNMKQAHILYVGKSRHSWMIPGAANGQTHFDLRRLRDSFINCFILHKGHPAVVAAAHSWDLFYFHDHLFDCFSPGLSK